MDIRDKEVARSQQKVRILVYSNHRPMIDLVTRSLSGELYLARAATSVDEAAELLATWDPGLAVIDIDGGLESTLTQIGLSRNRHLTNIPVLALTRIGDTKTKLAAFARGVDDVITFPFSPEEFQARVLVMVRRSSDHTATLNPVLKLGDLKIDVLGRRICDGSSELRLTGTEQGLLCLLGANAGEIVSHDQILDALWGRDYAPDSNVVGRLIYRLRAKLQRDWRRPQSIVTVPGQGYRLVPELLQSRRPPARSKASSSRTASDHRQSAGSSRSVASADPRAVLAPSAAFSGAR